MQVFYESLFTKSIKLGCAASTVNKVFGKNFIPQFECMLAENYFDYAEKVEGNDFTITLKLVLFTWMCAQCRSYGVRL
jgi:DNA ligase-1